MLSVDQIWVASYNVMDVDVTGIYYIVRGGWKRERWVLKNKLQLIQVTYMHIEL